MVGTKEDWEKAIDIVIKEYPEVPLGNAQWWGLVLGVFKRMQGRKPLKPLKTIHKTFSSETIAILALLEPLFSSGFTTPEQVILDFPAPPVSVALPLLAPHHAFFFPQYHQTHTSAQIRDAYSKNPIFLPLPYDAIQKVARGEPVYLNKRLGEEPDWVDIFQQTWYLGLLAGLIKGEFLPRSRAALSWFLQLATNPALKKHYYTQLANAINKIALATADIKNINMSDVLCFNHMPGRFKVNKPREGVILHPNAIINAWGVPIKCLSEPAFPQTTEPKHLYDWCMRWLNLLRPATHILNNEDTNLWAIFYPRQIKFPLSECLVVTSFVPIDKAKIPVIIMEKARMNISLNEQIEYMIRKLEA